MRNKGQGALRGFIQAGGRSSRMGQDKSWLDVGGRRLIERVLTAAAPVVEDLSMIINPANPRAAEYEILARTWKARLIHDLHDHRGPLGGIHTALRSCAPDQAALILACDLPYLTSEFLSRLSQIHGDEVQRSLIRNRQSLALVTLPVDQTGRMQPLAGIYAAACLPAVEQMLAEDLLRVDRLYERINIRQVLFREICDLPEADRLFLNLNTLDDYSTVTG